MQVLQGMDPDKMIIVLPTALIAMYLIISLQNHLCRHRNKYVGLLLPGFSFVVSTILAVRPLFVADAGEFDGLITFCIRMWLTFNIVTLVFLFPYYKHRKTMHAAEKEFDALSQSAEDISTKNSDSKQNKN